MFLLTFSLTLACLSIPGDEGFPLELVNKLNLEHAERIDRGVQSGTITIEERNRGEPTTLLKLTYDLRFSGDSFLLERRYSVNLLEKKHKIGKWVLDSEPFSRTVLLRLNGKGYWAKFDGTGNASCYILDDNWTKLVLKNWDSPGNHHPAHVWDGAQELLAHTKQESLNWKKQEIKDGGLIARGAKGTVSGELYILPSAPGRLARLRLFKGNLPAFECNLQWGKEDGVAYVKRFQFVARSPGLERVVKREVTVTDSALNEHIEQEKLSLQILGVRPGTVFRMNAPVPAQFVFDGEKLVAMED